MGAAVVAAEAHDDEVAEIGNAGLAHAHLAHHVAGMTGQLENCCLLVEEVALLERTREIQLCAQSLCLNCLFFGLGVLLTVSHCHQLLERSFEIGDLQILVLLGCVGVFNG